MSASSVQPPQKPKDAPKTPAAKPPSPTSILASNMAKNQIANLRAPKQPK